MQEAGVIFKSKQPHTTLFLKVGFHEDHEPKELFDALSKVGWERDKSPFSREIRFPNGEKEVNLTSAGSGLFLSWTPEEKKEKMRRARAVLRKFGYVNVPHHKMTLADML